MKPVANLRHKRSQLRGASWVEGGKLKTRRVSRCLLKGLSREFKLNLVDDLWRKHDETLSYPAVNGLVLFGSLLVMSDVI